MVKSLLHPLLLYTQAIFIVMYPLNYVKISIVPVPFAILIFTLCLQNSGETTVAELFLAGGTRFFE